MATKLELDTAAHCPAGNLSDTLVHVILKPKGTKSEIVFGELW